MRGASERMKEARKQSSIVRLFFARINVSKCKTRTVLKLDALEEFIINLKRDASVPAWACVVHFRQRALFLFAFHLCVTVHKAKAFLKSFITIRRLMMRMTRGESIRFRSAMSRSLKL